ncbi:MAG: rhodanese-like domain-containing protein [Marinicella sp.]
MKRSLSITLFFISSVFTEQVIAQEIPNDLIDPIIFENLVSTTLVERDTKRLNEQQFIQAIESKNYILLDARSKNNYELRHIKHAINLPFTEFTAQTLAAVIPNKDTKILIYCNNNFLGSPVSFAAKMPAASLNLSTQVSLAAYGYNEVYELGPLLDVANTKLEFEGTEKWTPLTVFGQQ